MKLLRYLLSHGILLLFIVALVFAYYYRTQLFSVKVNTRIDSAVEKSLAWTEIFMKKAKGLGAKTQSGQGETAAVAPVDAQQTASAEPAAQQPPLIDTPPRPALEQMTVATASDQGNTGNTGVSGSVGGTDQDVAVAVTDTSTTSDSGTASDDKSAAAVSHAGLLEQARSAYANGDPDQAIKLYEELSELNADDPNTFGELGNVFYSQGKWQKAGVAYYDAATRLLANGQTAQVEYLYRVIQGLDHESAEKLRSQLGK